MLKEEKLFICYIFITDKDLVFPVIGSGSERCIFFKKITNSSSATSNFCITYRNGIVFKVESSISMLQTCCRMYL